MIGFLLDLVKEILGPEIGKKIDSFKKARQKGRIEEAVGKGYHISEGGLFLSKDERDQLCDALQEKGLKPYLSTKDQIPERSGEGYELVEISGLQVRYKELWLMAREEST